MSSDDEQAELAQLRAQRNARTGVSSVVRSLQTPKQLILRAQQDFVQALQCCKLFHWLQKALRQQVQSQHVPATTFFEDADHRCGFVFCTYWPSTLHLCLQLLPSFAHASFTSHLQQVYVCTQLMASQFVCFSLLRHHAPQAFFTCQVLCKQGR